MKDKIVQKATEMFLNYGFKSVTMDDISKALGISKKTLYTHFNNKTQLVKEATSCLHEHTECEISEIFKRDLNAIQELFEVKRFVLSIIKDDESSPHFQLQKFFPDIHEELKKKQLSAMINSILNNIDKGIKEGVYRTEIHKELIARIYFTTMSGIKDDEVFPSKLFKKQELLEAVLDYHIRAIATPKGLTILNQFTNNQ
ncbi:TetR/AcrR family transcriptional regulator [Ochrovirga pacifica]|uniref:TetR/AcrR family transcriptional regulator n=1 Tax=Ochrovirga pacifica TaxID=1042376 RepID=UPI000255A009|nr:TetR/AcrR family transcriptional regulator [Ochrovirga pacifica]